MSNFICSSCRNTFKQTIRLYQRPFIRHYVEPVNISTLLSKPTWSVRSLLPDPDSVPVDEITPKQLHHLLRLSALPVPKTPEEEDEMLKILHSQLHFVKDIQKVDTEGIEPLQSIRDETKQGISHDTINLKNLKSTLEMEDIVGRSKRPRRRKEDPTEAPSAEDWDVMGAASEKLDTPGGSFFIVRSGNEEEKQP